MKKAAWVGVAIAIAVAGAWGYGALVRQENDLGAAVRLLAIAEDQTLDLSLSRSGRVVEPRSGRRANRSRRATSLRASNSRAWPKTRRTTSVSGPSFRRAS